MEGMAIAEKPREPLTFWQTVGAVATSGLLLSLVSVITVRLVMPKPPASNQL
jgi:hypothetical protein